MQQSGSTIGSIAREMLDNYTRRQRSDGSQFWDFREEIDWQDKIVSNALAGRSMTSETREALFHCLLEIHLADNIEQAEEFVFEIQPYADVRELTAWLNASPAHMQYLNKVLHDYKIEDGVELLAGANQIYLKELGGNLVTAINSYMAEDLVFAMN